MSISFENVSETISGEVGDVEAGVVETFARLGIKEPRTAPEKLAIHLAKTLDKHPEDKVIAGLSRELRLCLEEVRNQPEPASDFLADLQDRQ